MNKILFLTVSLLSFMGAAETIKEIPKEIAPVLTAYESEAKKAWDAYQVALKKAEDKAKKDLGAKMAPALKKGDLDTANAIKVYLDKVTSGEAVSEYEVAWNAAKKDLDLLGDGAKGLVILEATWGIPGKTADVTEIIKKQVKDNKLSLVYVGNFAGVADPVPFSRKNFYLKYSVGGTVKAAEFKENDVVNIPSK
jgi:hypothetical protein